MSEDEKKPVRVLRGFAQIAKLAPEERLEKQLEHLDSLLAQATKAREFDAALKIVVAASDMIEKAPGPRRKR